MSTAYISHPSCRQHAMGADHPERPERLSAIEDQLMAAGLFYLLQHHEAPAASVEQLSHVHDVLYIDEILAASPQQGLVHIDPDTYMNPHTVTAALHAAGAAVLATDLVLGSTARNAFCGIRPPGHHAERHQAMGFCFFNNVAVGAAHALEHHGLARVAIADFDVHHGNGTEDIFADEPRVLVCSTYQHPLYPFSGVETVDGHLVNVPLRAGTGGAEFRRAVETHWLPQLEAFGPQMVFVSAGFDAHIEDPLAELALTEADYAWVTRKLMAMAERHAGARLVSVLEGGYALSALGRSVAAHVGTLMGVR